MYEKLGSFWIDGRKEERKSQKTHKKGIFLPFSVSLCPGRAKILIKCQCVISWKWTTARCERR